MLADNAGHSADLSIAAVLSLTGLNLIITTKKSTKGISVLLDGFNKRLVNETVQHIVACHACDTQVVTHLQSVDS